MTSPSKAKGNSFERILALKLSQLYGETFIRAPGSGAYVGGSNSIRKDYLHEGQIRSFKGDIVPGQSFSKMNAEAKSYKDFPFHQLLQGSCKQFDGWIEQMLEVADQGDFSILFMKFNRKGTFVAVDSTYPWDHTLAHIRYFSKNSSSWHIFDLDNFLKHNSELVKTLCRSNT
jgi:hypothetical protein